MAEEEESFENLDDLDWSDVESELKANRDQILSEVKSDGAGDQQEGQEVDGTAKASDETGAAKDSSCRRYRYQLSV